MPDPLAARRRERERLLATAGDYVQQLATRVPLVAAAVAGSVARGDFNVWSDVDVVVVAEDLPERATDRSGLLLENAPGGIQPLGFTPDEFLAAWRKGNPLVREAVEAGVVLVGAEFFTDAAGEPGRTPLPGAELVERGIGDLERNVESIEALLVSIGAPRLRGLGVLVDQPIPRAEHRLYERLSEQHGDAAHARYNALVRRLASFERAAVTAGHRHA